MTCFVISEKYRVRRLLAHSPYNLLTGLHSKTKLKLGVHIHQPTAWPVPHACTQPYHPGSGSHGQLFLPYWVHQHGIAVGSMNGLTRVSKTLYCRSESKHSFKRKLHTTHSIAWRWSFSFIKVLVKLQRDALIKIENGNQHFKVKTTLWSNRNIPPC